MTDKPYFVYLIQCRDQRLSLYCGVTTDLERRLYEHNNNSHGAKFTRPRRPVTLVWSREFDNKIDAYKEEYRIKHLTRKEKLELIQR